MKWSPSAQAYNLIWLSKTSMCRWPINEPLISTHRSLRPSKLMPPNTLLTNLRSGYAQQYLQHETVHMSPVLHSSTCMLHRPFSLARSTRQGNTYERSLDHKLPSCNLLNTVCAETWTRSISISKRSCCRLPCTTWLNDQTQSWAGVVTL
jgi:hypothetical protein